MPAEPPRLLATAEFEDLPDGSARRALKGFMTVIGYDIDNPNDVKALQAGYAFMRASR